MLTKTVTQISLRNGEQKATRFTLTNTTNEAALPTIVTRRYQREGTVEVTTRNLQTGSETGETVIDPATLPEL